MTLSFGFVTRIFLYFDKNSAIIHCNKLPPKNYLAIIIPQEKSTLDRCNDESFSPWKKVRRRFTEINNRRVHINDWLRLHPRPDHEETSGSRRRIARWTVTRPYHGHHGRNGPGQREYCNCNYVEWTTKCRQKLLHSRLLSSLLLTRKFHFIYELKLEQNALSRIYRHFSNVSQYLYIPSLSLKVHFDLT